ncbi:MAG TPA: FAD-dependent oxidoreductase [Candidatus Saccharimonadales bacterium]|nr:FAD-dependent oxidoreductase [Candidatus Saccharimonadales bacterium]
MKETLSFIRSYQNEGTVRTFVFDQSGRSWVPGQYEQYHLPQVGGTDDENSRFFTIASAPVEGEIHISTRVTESKFKQALNALQPGDTIEVDDVEGDFIWDNDEPVVLVAAGIGSTPYRSMLLQRNADGKPLNATVLYYSRDENIPFRSEFDALAANHPELKIQYIVGQPVTSDSILELASPAAGQTVFISGPEPMVDSIGEDLKARGVNLKQDWFPGYTESTF